MERRQIVDASIDTIAGIAGAVTSVYVGQPLDTIKVKMQTFPDLYPTTYKCFTDTLRQDGIFRGLYAGTVPSLAAQVSENAVLFCAYGLCQKGIAWVRNKEDESTLTVVDKSLAGSLAGMFAAVVLCPTESVKCRMQAAREMRPGLSSTFREHGGLDSNRHLNDPLQIMKDILRKRGFFNGVYRGMFATLVREMFGYSFFFGGYELSKTVLLPRNDETDTNVGLRTILCGSAGGVAFWIAIFPADVIKSRVQIQDHNNLTFIQMMLHIYRAEGAKALYRGLGPTLARTIPASGGLFLAYEYTKTYLHKCVST